MKGKGIKTGWDLEEIWQVRKRIPKGVNLLIPTPNRTTTAFGGTLMGGRSVSAPATSNGSLTALCPGILPPQGQREKVQKLNREFRTTKPFTLP